MDLLARLSQGSRNYTSAVTWFLSSDIRPTAGFVSSRRLLLFGLYNASLNRSRTLFIVTGQAEAMEALARFRPGLLILTPNLDQGSGLELVQQARSVVRDLRTILICDAGSDDLVAAGQSVADGVLCEQDVLEESEPFKAMVVAMALGRRYRSPAVQAALSAFEEQAEQTWRDHAPTLTAREQELVDLWVEGLGDREVAERLGVSYATVRSYGRTVRQKLGVATRGQVVLKVLKLGLSRLRVG